MAWLQKHLRNTLLAGALAAAPLAVTVFVVWYVESTTRIISEKVLGRGVPFLGVLIALAAVYALGLFIRSVLGRLALRLVDATLNRVPGLRSAYGAWKQIALTPGGGEGMFAKVCLVRDETGRRFELAFTSGVPVEGTAAAADPLLCVFVPACPNPMNGRLLLVPRSDCRVVEHLAAEEAFKVVLSTGNYTPRELGVAAAAGITSPSSALPNARPVVE
jgi:uncharacterized membrane protein